MCTALCFAVTDCVFICSLNFSSVSRFLIHSNVLTLSLSDMYFHSVFHFHLLPPSLLPILSSPLPLLVSVSLPEEVQTAFANLWEEQKFNDVYFVISGQRIPAHKVVLAAQSQYFECMLFGNMREASMNEIPLEGVPVSAFRKVLQFAYTGTLQMDNVALQVGD